jgi:putative chitinase
MADEKDQELVWEEVLDPANLTNWIFRNIWLPPALTPDIKETSYMITPAMKKEYKKLVGPMSKESEDGLTKLIEEINNDAALKDCPDFVAYMLATVWHETWVPKENKRFLPVSETHPGPRTAKARDEYFESKYGCETKVGKKLGNTLPGDGSTYFGRGYVQITGKANYERISKRLGKGDFLISPNCQGFANCNPFAYEILAVGMREGLFTGKKLADYRKKGGGFDFVGARAIVNGKDKAEVIAAHAEAVYSILVRDEKKEEVA